MKWKHFLKEAVVSALFLHSTQASSDSTISSNSDIDVNRASKVTFNTRDTLHVYTASSEEDSVDDIDSLTLNYKTDSPTPQSSEESLPDTEDLNTSQQTPPKPSISIEENPADKAISELDALNRDLESILSTMPSSSGTNAIKPTSHNTIVLDSPDVSDNDCVDGNRWSDQEDPDLLANPSKEETENLIKRRQLLKQHAHIQMFSDLNEFPSLEIRKTVKVLIFYNCKFTTMPETIYEYTDLCSITLNNCSIKKLPDNMSNFKQLTALHINNCKNLESLPPLLFECPLLDDLSVIECSLKTLPDNIGMAALVDLSLNGNNLRKIPETISSLSKLQSLNLANNQIEALPENISDLLSLKILNLSHNRIVFTKKNNRLFSAILEIIPKVYYTRGPGVERSKKEYMPLPNLETADLSYNMFEYIPSIFFVSDRVKSIDFSNNQIKTVDRLADYLLRRPEFSHLNLRGNEDLYEYGNLHEEYGFREMFWLFNRKVLLSDNVLDKLSQPISKATAYNILSLRTLEENVWNYKSVRRIRKQSEPKFDKNIDCNQFHEVALRYKINEYLNTIKQNVMHSLFSFPVYSNTPNIVGLGEYWSYIMEDEVGPGNSKIWAFMGPPYPYSTRNLEDPFFNSIGNAILAFYTRFTVKVAAEYIRNKINSENTFVKAVIQYAHHNCSEHTYTHLFTYNTEPMKYAEISTECAVLLLKHFNYIE
ncbi:hypothetical protein NEIRO03_0273 [Nematocida sp. AWRm78]|nr:hypothetical protein NEIRO02_0274 [Nematocida sp. AWRm79]KAI5182609.1 hypothetical protein NEIRO03_0273 [Nematocida sp. AWRm78]